MDFTHRAQRFARRAAPLCVAVYAVCAALWAGSGAQPTARGLSGLMLLLAALSWTGLALLVRYRGRAGCPWVSKRVHTARHATRVVWSAGVTLLAYTLTFCALLPAYIALVGQSGVWETAALACAAFLFAQALGVRALRRPVVGRARMWSGAAMMGCAAAAFAVRLELPALTNGIAARVAGWIAALL